MYIEETCLLHFSELPDPRKQGPNFRHKLEDIFIISVLGTICGADGWAELERFGQAKEDWLRTFLELPNGIPSHDTFGRVFSQLDPVVFERCFMNWIESLTVELKQEIIALDGKTVRGSGSKANKQSPLHLVSAWASKQRMLLAQVKTSEKSNEITAIPELLNLIDIKDSIITIDAMGCQQKIAKQIRKQGGDYVLCLKENQKSLYDTVKAFFQEAEKIKDKQYKNILRFTKVEKDKNHGRQERRQYTLVSPRASSQFALRWPGLKGVGKVVTKRTINNETTRSTRYFLTSLEYKDIDLFKQSVRQHWRVEIDLHWSLDVSFKEDHSQVRIGNSAQNLALIRRIALNLLKQEKTHKNGIACRRKSAGWDHSYLLKVLKADAHLTQK